MADLRTIDEQIAAWHDTDTLVTLWDWLGWTREEYAAWLVTGDAPSRLRGVE